MEKENETKTVVPALRFPEFRGTKGWEEKKMGEIGNFIGGGTPNTNNPEYWDGEILWYTPTEIKNGRLNNSNRKITEQGLRNSSAKLLPKGAILITTRATIGEVAISEKECTTNQGFQSLVVKDSEVNSFWFYWIIQHKEELIKRASGSTFKEIGKTEIINITVYSAKQQEQQKIADCLSSLDNLIEATNRKIEALKEHKKGLMQRLFPKGGGNVPELRFPEFQGTKGWEEKKLTSLCDITNGKCNAQDHIEGGKYPLFDRSAVVKYSNNYLYDCEAVIIPGEGVRFIPKYYNGKFNLHQRAYALKDFSCNGKFLFYDMEYHSGLLAVKAVKSTVLSLRLPILQNFPLHIPFEDVEQQKIADCLSSLDELIEATSQKVEVLKEHKKGLMQQLFPKI